MIANENTEFYDFVTDYEKIKPIMLADETFLVG